MLTNSRICQIRLEKKKAVRPLPRTTLLNLNKPMKGYKMNLPVLNANVNTPITMSSREIAELLVSRHDKVKQSIDRLVTKGVIVQPPMGDEQDIDAMGRKRTTTVYYLEKRDTYVVVAQLSPEFTARLVDRWQELEESVKIEALPDFTNPAIAARAWAEQFE